MKRIILCISLFAFFGSQAQQINPVPDYVFSNKMSVGRNAVTDTAAYFSIGPRYGAIRGMMPPMVTDTASMSATKRNGLLIFSIQKNKYLYWDSVGSKWAEMAGTTGTALTSGDTASMLSPYIRAAGNGLTKSGQSLLVDTAAIATRARVQKAVDSINTNVALKVNISDTASMLTNYTRGSGTTNYLPKFTGSRTLGNSQIFDNGTNVGINNTSPSEKLHVTGNIRTTSGNMSINSALNAWNSSSSVLQVGNNSSIENFNNLVFISEYNAYRASGGYVYQESSRPSLAFYMIVDGYFGWANAPSGTAGNPITYTDRMRLTLDGELLLGTTTDAGAYALQVAGSIYNTTGAVLAASSGNVGIGTASPSFKLDVVGNTQISGNVQLGLSSSSNSRLYIFNSTNDNRGEIYFDGTNNRFAISSTYGGSGSFQALDLLTSEQTRVRVKSDGEVLIGTTTDAGTYVLQVSGAIYNTTTITTGAPTGGSIKPWRLGEAAIVSPTSPNRTIRVEIDGTVYYIHAKTTND